MSMSGNIAAAMRAFMAREKELIVKAEYSRAGQPHVVTGVRSDLTRTAEVDGGGIHRMAKGGLRVLVADLGKAPPEVADPITIADGGAAKQFQIVDLRYDNLRASLVIQYGDKYA